MGSDTSTARNTSLLAWYDDHARQLPWRSTTDPYCILVSEVMSQQTQIDRVVPRYERFIARWPTVADLAEATNDEVLTEWSGLGYNTRALRLRDTAQVIVADGWPRTPEGLRTLPGVGPYTANAISSIAFGVPVPAIDTNLRRVISRWHGAQLDGTELREIATSLVDRGDPGAWNQAIMDLAAAVCRPVAPDCAKCPVADHCLDPSVTVRPARQGRFAGSQRQLRGALVRAHLTGDDFVAVGTGMGFSTDHVAATVAELRSEGLVGDVA